MNGYDLTRAWYNFKFDNSKLVRPIHSDLFFFIIDKWNRLGQKKEFGLPTDSTLEMLGIGSYNTYKKALYGLVQFGFIKIVADSKNQHHAKVIALSKIDKATDKALDKATIKAIDKATDEAVDKATDKAIDTIIEQLNKGTIEQLNKGTKNKFKEIYNLLDKTFKTSEVEPLKTKEISKIQKEKKFDTKDFRKIFIDLGCDPIHLDDWLSVRKKKRAVNSQTALKTIISECSKYNYPVADAIRNCAENSWSGFKHDWVKNISNTSNSKNTDYDERTKLTNEELTKRTMDSEVAKNFRLG